MRPIRVVLADDHALVRAGIRALLERLPRVEVVAEVDDGSGVLALLENVMPDVVVLDVAMKSVGGLEVAEEVSSRFPAVKVIVLSMHANEEYVSRALRAGASAYLVKDSATVELDLALESVTRGDIYLSPAISRSVVDRYLAAAPRGEPGAISLTPRQREILRFLAEGKTVKEIALELDLSIKTVESHRSALIARLGIHDTAGLVKYAMRIGLIPRI